MSKKKRPIILTVLDGWGYRAETAGNAIALARKPAYDELLRKFPNTLIHTSGPFVGLPEGQIFHAACQSVDGWTTVAIHDSKESLERFRDGILIPQIKQGISGGFTALPRETTFDVHNLIR